MMSDIKHWIERLQAKDEEIAGLTTRLLDAQALIATLQHQLAVQETEMDALKCRADCD